MKNSKIQKHTIMKIKITSFLTALILSGTFLAPSRASAFSDLLAFGDSLSDNGPADGFGITTFSNGPVWLDYLAGSSHLNISLTDLACVGATSGTDNPYAAAYINPALLNTGMLSQVNSYLTLTGSHISSNTLVALWAGANDLFNSRSYIDAVSNIGSAIQSLDGAGARNFLVLNLPNIGVTPYFQAGDPTVAAGATAWSQAFNATLGAELSTLESLHPSDHFFTPDIYSFTASVTADPAAYGLSSVSAMYWANDPFSPGLHPSTAGHSLIANYVATTVPEPSSWGLLVGGAGSLLASRRQRQR